MQARQAWHFDGLLPGVIDRGLFTDALTDGVVVLRRPVPDDLRVVERYIRGDDAQAWLSGTGDAAALFREFLAGWADPPQPNRFGLTLTIADHADGALVGVMHLEGDSRTVFLSYGVAPDRRRRGVASRAVSLVCDRAFAADFQRAELEIGDDNAASQGVARRTGFEPTDRRRSQVAEDGEVWHATAWTRTRAH